MTPDSKPSGDTDLSARAAVAMLTLQVRAAEREAAEAEAAADGWDVDTALAQLRGRMEPLVDQRRQVLAGELASAREECGRRIAAAHAEARSIIDAATRSEAERVKAARAEAARAEAQRRHRDDTTEVEIGSSATDAQPGDWSDDWWGDRPAAPPAAPEPEPEHVPVDDVFVRHQRSSQRSAPAVEHAVDAGELLDTTWQRPAPSAATHAARPGLPPPDAANGPITVVIDAEAFAQALSAALSAVLDERIARLAGFQHNPWAGQLPPGAAMPPWQMGSAVRPDMHGYWTQPGQIPPGQWMPMGMPQQQPVQAKKSFWADTWHADVILSVLAMVIVIIVLVAWSA